MILSPKQIENFISDAFSYYKKESLSNLDIIENDNYYFISVTLNNNGKHIMHRYFIVTIHKWLNYKIIYSDSNIIDSDKTITAIEVKKRTISYLKHLQNDINY